MREDGPVSPAPDAAQREAAHALEVRKRMREVEESILARAPEHDLEPSLDRIRAVMELAGDPQRTFPVVHVTGTNGKTSTARIVESVLREMGLKTGRFTSPHLHSMLERIAVAGRPIEAERFLAAYDDVAPFIDLVDARSAEEGGPRMTYFEVLVAVAYAAFADLPVDVAVVEVGMGGAWDATNVVDAPVSVITPIDVDHRHFLGDTPEEIAGEKSGIIKPDAITVSAVQPDLAAAEVLVDRATEVGARIVFEGNDFGVTAHDVAVGGQQLSLRGLAAEYPDLFLPLHGTHQAQNAAVAVAAVEAFVGGGEQPLDIEVLRAGLAAVESPGRLEIVRRSPTVLVDAAHNPAGARALRDALSEAFTFVRLVGVLAVMRDKDAAEMLELLEPVLDEVVVSRNSSPRSMRAAELGEIASDIFGEHRVTVVDDLPDALDRAAGLADEGGVAGGVLATGSVVTAADVRMLLGTTEV
ncbi:bifunctional folylpolyglutamate synthase/dihydrofolate synthase [Phycicoccus sonneratiae]|uniref:tetrahydrofolate synthase n=1 Tax=Phycicoccus sonneratiae TaxID=2807628 RepID=A0ABS2CGT6_9MICO|nr:folylpolyglutamate synthase/dihydrofolate synthase family protein [Phycicoccus sonneraticus]MBM6399030.1 bifunctional folylpolyglutamate synthase/dihydrofolate synthase [Phycicoccus sonneraticus]